MNGTQVKSVRTKIVITRLARRQWVVVSESKAVQAVVLSDGGLEYSILFYRIG
jgi:hypothetical protein